MCDKIKTELDAQMNDSFRDAQLEATGTTNSFQRVVLKNIQQEVKSGVK